MAELQALRATLLEDRKITLDEVRVIQEHLHRDERLDLEDVKFLVQLACDAEELCPEFDDLFFPVLKQVVLADGRIGHDERFYLLKMLYADGRVREREKEFLLELRREATEVTPEFDEMCETALKAKATNWDLG